VEEGRKVWEGILQILNILETLKSWIWMIVNNKFFEKNPKQLFVLVNPMNP